MLYSIDTFFVVNAFTREFESLIIIWGEENLILITPLEHCMGFHLV